jgi:hypothetical protein
MISSRQAIPTSTSVLLFYSDSFYKANSNGRDRTMILNRQAIPTSTSVLYLE